MANEQNKKSREEETPVHLTSDSTLQSPQEAEHDKSIDPRKDNTIGVSDTDLKETDADRYGGPNKTGPIERQP